MNPMAPYFVFEFVGDPPLPELLSRLPQFLCLDAPGSAAFERGEERYRLLQQITLDELEVHLEIAGAAVSYAFENLQLLIALKNRAIAAGAAPQNVVLEALGVLAH